jgi:hypothetical protein
MSKFEAGKTYFTRSACDHNCIFKVAVVSRTAKTIRASVDGEAPRTLRISLYRDVEQVMPKGNYSMAPIVGADKQGPSDLPTTEQAERAANDAAARRRMMRLVAA